jgi:hypothetical protein
MVNEDIAMPRRRQVEETPESSSALTARLNLLCKLIWKGNRSRMAKDLGISQPVMSRVLAGQQAPSTKLLEALARWPRLNVRWLFNGEGEPLSDRGLGDGGGHFCPVASRLLPGSPQEHPELLTGLSLAVATAYYSPTTYYYRLEPRDPLVGAKGSRMAAGDYLLIETAPAWVSRPAAFRGRLGVFRSRDRDELIIGRIARYEEDPYERKDLLDYRVETVGEFRSAIFRPNANRARAASEKVAAGVTLFCGDDLVGVARLLARLLDPE